MTITNNISTTVTYGNSRLSSSNDYVGTLNTIIDEPIPDSATDELITFTLDVANTQSFYIVSDQDVLAEFNNASVPTPAISLKAGVAYYWTIDSYEAFLLTVDITPGVYITNASGAIANVKIVALVDATP